MKWVKKNDQKKKEAKEKDIWAQLKPQPAPSREAHFVRTNRKSLSYWSPFPMNFWLNVQKEIKNLGCKVVSLKKRKEKETKANPH